MRLWSIHPSYLDAKGLVALWREGLLAQEVLRGNTKGYKNHPQLARFRKTANPVGAIASYLRRIADEADGRGYKFDREKIAGKFIKGRMPVTSGQLEYELEHLLEKLELRDAELYGRLRRVKKIKVNPVFKQVCGPVAQWEIIRRVNGKISANVKAQRRSASSR